MKKRIYKAPHIVLVLSEIDIMQNNLPIGQSWDSTDSGDEDGGGLAKDYEFDFEEGNWDDGNPWKWHCDE